MKMGKKQHYVPQFYLKKFLADGSEKLWVYDKIRDVEEDKHVSKVCEKKRYYNFSEKELMILAASNRLIEKDFLESDFFDKQIETPFGKLLTKLLIDIEESYKQGRFTDGLINLDRLSFAKFMLIQFLRTPMSYEQTKDVITKIRNSKSHPHKAIYESNKELSDYLENEEHRALTFAHLCGVLDFPKKDMALKLAFDKWQFIYSPEPVFYTSDTPVAFYRHSTGEILHKGVFASDDVEVIYPLSSKVALFIYNRSYFKEADDNVIVLSNKQLIDKVNAIMYNSAQRHVISTFEGIVKYKIGVSSI